MSQITEHLHQREYWLSLSQLTGSAEFREKLSQEFPGYDPDEIQGMPRRRFLQLMGGSMALAGLTLTGCRRWPESQLAPYAARPDQRIPGVSERYATVMEVGGIGTGLLVSCYDGRPVKIEGNPTHPYSLGASDAQAQASVLELYDPDRSRFPIFREGNPRKTTWQQFQSYASDMMQSFRTQKGEGFAVLSGATSSPSMLDMRARLLERLPQCHWYEYEPIHRDNMIEGTRLAFGLSLRPLYQLEHARVTASFDGDFLYGDPQHLRLARFWSKGRSHADHANDTMNQLWMAESSFSVSGSVADVRLPAAPSRLESMLVALGRQCGVEGLPDAGPLSPSETSFISRLSKSLMKAGRNGLVIAGNQLSPNSTAVAHRINQKLGAIGHTITFVREPSDGHPGSAQAIRSLTNAMNAGEVESLVILGGNPVYDAPADLGFAHAMKQVPHTMHLGLYHNETSGACRWHVPQAHFLESWGDARAWDGTLSICQPLILPLYDGKTSSELLALLIEDSVRSGHEISQRAFRQLLGARGIGATEFDHVWRQSLHDGMCENTAWAPIDTASLKSGVVVPSQEQRSAELSKGPASSQEWVEAVFVPGYGVYDGRYANNGWLQELPDPLTKVVWDNPALISAGLAKKLNLVTGDVVSVRRHRPHESAAPKTSSASTTVDMAVFVMPGLSDGVIVLPLGYGRSAAGNIGNGVGFDTYPLRFSEDLSSSFTPVSLEKAGRNYPLAMTADHHALDAVGAWAVQHRAGVPGENGTIIREASLDEYRKDPKFAHRDEHGNYKLQLFDPPAQFNDPNAWGMAVDLNSCIGCNGCVIACQAENNVPIVGKDQVLKSREMHWLRIDRYFKGDLEDPQVVHQPMMCVHCENAPCEQVCPVAATVHDSEGLNTMVYNRCIGTRYCSNNCPYKVRRFNYFDFHSKDPRGHAKPWLGMPDTQQRHEINEIKQMVYNPDVTVRMRGVMEKCTYCVQRIMSAKIDRRNQGQEVQDGDIQTACQQACPTQAIVFGNINDPGSRVRKLQEHNRAYAVLGELNVRPRTKYLAKIRNWEGVEKESIRNH